MMLQHPDSLRSVLDSVFAAPVYRWVERRDPLAGVIHAWLAIKEWFNNLQDTQPVLYHIVAYLLVAGVLALIAHDRRSGIEHCEPGEAVPTQEP